MPRWSYSQFWKCPSLGHILIGLFDINAVEIRHIVKDFDAVAIDINPPGIIVPYIIVGG
jgi:hypothetical protein